MSYGFSTGTRRSTKKDERIYIRSNYGAESTTYTIDKGDGTTLAGPFSDYTEAKQRLNALKVEHATTLPSGKKRVKTVFTSDEVPHLWMHKAQQKARSSNGNLFFEGDTIYSYGHHFPIARHVSRARGKVAILFNTDRHSVTTSGHQSQVRMAIPSSVAVFDVPNLGGSYRGEMNLTASDHSANLKAYQQGVSKGILKAARARSGQEYDLRRATEMRNEAIAYAKFFGVKCPKLETVPENNSEQLSVIRKRESQRIAKIDKKTREQNKRQEKARAKEYRERIKEWMKSHPEYAARWDGTTENAEVLAKELKDAERAALELSRLRGWMAERPELAETWDGTLLQGSALKEEFLKAVAIKRNAENIAAWLRGEQVSTYGLHDVPTMLRINGDNVETSMGVRFPVSHAVKGLRLIQSVMARGEEWKTNGHTCHLGHYQIERITADGTVFAGCHVVTWEAIERIASDLLAAANTGQDESTDCEAQ